MSTAILPYKQGIVATRYLSPLMGIKTAHVLYFIKCQKPDCLNVRSVLVLIKCIISLNIEPPGIIISHYTSINFV